jgi:DNA-directed RNA polymerase beta subunit
MAKDTIRPILVDAPTQRENIRNKIITAIKQTFPLETKNYTVHLEDIHSQPAQFSSREQKAAIMEGKSLNEPLKGSLVVKDKQGNVVSSTKNFTLAHVPYFTERHTFIVDGNEYSVSNQIRIKPGVYTRRRGNAELEAAFNLAKGSNFRISMDPDEGHLHMEYGTSRIPLYPVLKALGVPHTDIAKHWGPGVADNNRAAFDDKTEKHVDKLYDRLIPDSRKTATTPEAKARDIANYYSNTVMDPKVNEKTLGQGFDRVSPTALLAASQKLINVHRAAEDTDDRDSLEFKTFHSVDDFLKERVGLDARLLKNKFAMKLDQAKGDVRKAIPTGPFSRSLRSFITTASLSAIPMQINPMELVDHAMRVTSLGEGGISSERAVPLEARNLHPTHFGFLDPVRTPESSRAGVDVRAALFAKRDDDGNLYATFKNVKTGKLEHLTPTEVLHSVIAFPLEKVEGSNTVDAMVQGKLERVASSKVTHQVPHASYLFGPTSNLIPFINSMQGNRAIMGAKMQTQALPLVQREAPHVQVESHKGDSFHKEFVKLIVPTAPVSGTISRIDDDYIYLKPDPAHKLSADTSLVSDDEIYNDFMKLGEEEIKLHYDTNFPLAAKTYLHNDLTIKPGDRVEAGQHLAESNFTKDGTLALGKNMRIAYMAYRGLNSNDGVVISEGAAKKLTSEHMYKSILEIDPDTVLGKERHRTYYGNKYLAAQYAHLDDDGIVKPGVVVNPKDPLIVSLRKTQLSAEAAMLGKLSKALIKPYSDAALCWEHDHQGTVIDVVKTPGRITVTVKTEEPMNIGDKLSGQFGNKGVVAKIVPDHEMIQDEKGRPVDVLYTSAGIISRVNPSQVVEAALGKVAEHTGKPVIIKNFGELDNVKFAKDLLQKHGLKDKETVFDPVTGKHVPDIFVGNAYTFKLFKTTDSNWSAHGVKNYDLNQQPARGGDEGSKAIGKMEFDGLVAHNARNILREAASIKSNRNDEFWRSVQLGLPTPPPKTSFAYDKFLNMLHGAGIKVDKQGSKLALGPLTDNDIEKMSSGAVTKPVFIRSKDLMPEDHGFFDHVTTGGVSGTRFAHFDLHEPIVNPVFEEPVRRLLGLTQRQFEEMHGEHGGAFIKQKLSSIDVDKKISELRTRIKTLRGANLDDAVKQVKYLEALKAQGLTPDKAYVLSKVPVTPPVIRPMLPDNTGNLQVSDVNLLYRDAFLANDKLKEAKQTLPKDMVAPVRNHVYQAVGALFGVNEPVSPNAEKRQAKGYINMITGTDPGSGFFQSKLLKKQQDVSGRATAAPDPTLGMDEIGIPEDMLWNMYEKFIVGRLVRKGYPAVTAQQMVKDKHPAAKEELLLESKERPVFVNRAPSLHRFNIVAAYPRITSGKTVTTNPFIEKGMNLDYDGDALQIHAPVTTGGVEDAKNMTLSKLIFVDKYKNSLNVAPDMESVIGLYVASHKVSDKPKKVFNSREDAIAAYNKGEIGLHDPVEIKQK